MLTQPLLKNLSEKAYDIAYFVFVVLMFIAMCAEADMYVPAFPQMIKYFGVQENAIQLILSLNFAGLCVAGLICGPLSDAFGRKKVLTAGLLLFVISSAGCVFAENFIVMLFWRLIQGIAASVPMVVAAAQIFDKYTEEKASQYIGILNSFITAGMAAAPLIGAILTQQYGWRSNFIVILILTIVCFIGAALFFGETLPQQKRKTFKLNLILNDYATLLKSPSFLGYSLLCIFSIPLMVMYISNLSVIFINHLDMPMQKFSYYQATTWGTFIIFSSLSAKIIAKKGIDFTAALGIIITLLGTFMLFTIGMKFAESPILICSSMAIVAIGGSFTIGPFSMKCMSIFPEMRGTSLSVITAIRQSLATCLVLLSEYFFDGTIKPVAIIIFIFGIIVGAVYLLLTKKPKTLAEAM